MVHSEHQALVAAIRAGDAATALVVLTEHREHAIAALRPMLEPVDDGAGTAQRKALS
ncbi:MAG: hypothetical protein ABI807_02980 [Sporichthyaceae bacterium]